MDEIFNEEFAEICGIHAGDGWLSSRDNEIGYATSVHEEQYFNYVYDLYSKMFKFKKCLILKTHNIVKFRIFSKNIQKIFMSVGFPKGPKIDNLRCPDFIFSNKKFIEKFLRGVVDTDGSVHWRRCINNHYISISWTTSCKNFADQIKKMLILLGFNPTIYSFERGDNRKTAWKVLLQSKRDVINFIKNIGFKNNRRWCCVLSRKESLKKYMARAGVPELIPEIIAKQSIESGHP